MMHFTKLIIKKKKRLVLKTRKLSVIDGLNIYKQKLRNNFIHSERKLREKCFNSIFKQSEPLSIFKVIKQSSSFHSFINPFNIT